MTIGLERCNPWNLSVRHIPWMGLLKDQPKDGPLAFENLLDGIRAGVKLCYTYGERGWNTPRKFVESFAPEDCGNPTAQYLQNVCDWSGYTPDQTLDFHDPHLMCEWAHAIFRQEQGASNGITDAQIYAGISLADDD